MKIVLETIIERCLKEKVKAEKELSAIKRWASKKFKISPPANIELIKVYHKLLKKGRAQNDKNFERLLRKRKVRSLSGVAVVSVLTKPYPCPGKCIYCPEEKGIPKSYLSGEPAVERAKKLNFDPYSQVKKRIDSLREQGHPTDKIELRIIGGSFSVYPDDYKTWFLKNCFAAANEKLKKKISSLKEEQKINEKVKHRIVGVSIETRPDLINKKEIKTLRELGVTMVELGVQTVFDKILEKCQRNHGTQETAQATKLLKDAGFKVMYQMMLSLPGSIPKKDSEAFRIIFQNQEFKPDWLKIYPCLVCKGTRLYQLWEEGAYHPYSNDTLINLLINIKINLPFWVRVARIFRDIPAQKIEAGSKISNLREVILEEMKKRNKRCYCIRCREVKENYDPKEKIYFFREDYNASDGKEIFLSFENKNRTKLFSFLRLRIPSYTLRLRPSPTVVGFGRRRSEGKPSQKYFLPVLKNSAIIREIHTYGELVPIAKKEVAPQHQGLGKKLVKEAEKITKKEFGLTKIAVISGIGARDYWRKLDYKLKETYMLKQLTTDN